MTGLDRANGTLGTATATTGCYSIQASRYSIQVNASVLTNPDIQTLKQSTREFVDREHSNSLVDRLCIAGSAAHQLPNHIHTQTISKQLDSLQCTNLTQLCISKCKGRQIWLPVQPSSRSTSTPAMPGLWSSCCDDHLQETGVTQIQKLVELWQSYQLQSLVGHLQAR